MNKLFRSTATTLISGMALLASSGAVFAADDEAAKLKELERALGGGASSSAPADSHTIGGASDGKKKVRTRAIVFDNAQETAPAPEAAPTPKQTAAMDCANLPADAKLNAVDFAIQFKVGSAEVSPSSEATLGSIAKILSLAPDRCVLVEGHTDASGSVDKNLSLSKDRAGSVVNYIAEKGGIDRKRLVPIGKGSSDPLKNLDPRDAKNRRVVFKVVSG
ncbi:MAG TPA: OmpA family protein [Rhodocyclaceae bacterium]|nr:OmpA family protein [Rhodocyclaceae bacterium]